MAGRCSLSAHARFAVAGLNRATLLLGIFLHGLGLVPFGGFLFGRRLDQRPDDAKANPAGIRMIPDAARYLWVLLFPFLVGSSPHRTAQHVGIVVPAATANDSRIQASSGSPAGSSTAIFCCVDSLRRTDRAPIRQRCRACRTAPRDWVSFGQPLGIDLRCCQRTRRSLPVQPRHRRMNRRSWCPRGRHIPTRPPSAAGNSVRSLALSHLQNVRAACCVMQIAG